LARLGVRFDRQIFESREAARIEPLLQAALERGLVTHDDDEALVYETGQPDYPQLPLGRPDGFPTQNLRTLTIWHTLMRELPGETVVHLSGSEWTAHAIYLEDLLGRLEPELAVYPTVNLVHGMVSADDGVVTSVGGDPILLDEIFDALAGRDELRALALAEDRGCGPDDLAAMALLGACLDRPLHKPLTLAPARLLDEEANTGWTLARAWARACDPANDGAVELSLDDPAYRFLVVRSQLHRRLVALAAERYDVLLLVRFLVHLSRWYLETPSSPAAARVMRTLLRAGLGALGLVRPRR
jgi:arginyl-tRNA synthetase